MSLSAGRASSLPSQLTLYAVSKDSLTQAKTGAQGIGEAYVRGFVKAGSARKTR